MHFILGCLARNHAQIFENLGRIPDVPVPGSGDHRRASRIAAGRWWHHSLQATQGSTARSTRSQCAKHQLHICFRALSGARQHVDSSLPW